MMKENRELFCNACGKKIKIENGILREDVFEGKKVWGYFSDKDAVYHSFILCEECYDKMISGFSIPVEETEVTEFL